MWYLAISVPYMLGYNIEELPFLPWPLSSLTFITAVIYEILYLALRYRPNLIPRRIFLTIIGIWAIVIAIAPLLQGR